MPDLSIIYCQMCASVDGPKYIKTDNGWTVGPLFWEGGEPACNCPSYIFGGKRNCKHIQAALNDACGWHSNYDEPQVDEGKCPRCGGETVTVRVAV